MRWFRRHDSDNNDPRLLSLSPLRGSDQTAPSPSPSSTLVGGTSTTETGWSFNRYPSTTCPTAPPTPAGNARLDRSSTVAASAYPAHLPCTLKRKPAVRRRSGGKGSSTRWQRHSTFDGSLEAAAPSPEPAASTCSGRSLTSPVNGFHTRIDGPVHRLPGNYASRVILYDDEPHENLFKLFDDSEERAWGTSVLPLAKDDCPAVEGRRRTRLSPIRAYPSSSDRDSDDPGVRREHGGHRHRRTASLDNIIDVMAEWVDLTAGPDSSMPASENRGCSQDSSDIRFTSTPSDSPDGKSRTDDSVGSAIGGGRFRTKLEKYLRRNGTLTAGILNRFKGRSTARPSSSDVASDMGGQRSSFRSFSCATLPALDQFHRRKLMAEGAEEFDSPATRSSPSSSAAAAIETSGGADNDSGIVPDSPYIRHYQPCQLLSSWRCRPQPKVRRSLSPIFQRRENDHHSDENSVPSDTEDEEVVPSYETIWPSPSAEENGPSAQSPAMQFVNALKIQLENEPTPPPTPSPPLRRDVETAALTDDSHTMRIHVEYPNPLPAESAVPPTACANDSDVTDTSNDGADAVRVFRIDRQPERLDTELGIFIAKKKFKRGARVGYVVAHIVSGGLIDRDGRLQLDDEIVSVNGHQLRNLSMSEASSILREPVPTVELTVCRRISDRTSHSSAEENVATIILVNAGRDPPSTRPVSPINYENISLLEDNVSLVIGAGSVSGGGGGVDLAGGRSSSLLDDSGVEISESGSCSSSDSMRNAEAESTTSSAAEESESAASPVPVSRRSYHRHSLVFPAQEPKVAGGAATEASTDFALGAATAGDKKAGDFCTLPRRPRLAVATTAAMAGAGSSQSFYTVVYEKGPGHKSLGFTLVGGIDSPKGAMGFYVKTIMPTGQAAEQATLRTGDEIVAINGRMLDGLRHAEAIGIFKSIKCGKIVLQVSRRQKKDQRKNISRSCDDLLKETANQ